MPVNLTIKKNTEFIWSSIYIDYLNKKYNFDYRPVPEYDEKSVVDVRAISESSQFPALDLQLTYAIEMPFISYAPTDLDYTRKPTQEAIDRKLKKYNHRNIDSSNLILIVQGYMNRAHAKFAFAHSSFKNYAHYPFKGIYYVSPTMVSGETNESLQQGLVVPIKDAFDK